MSDARLSADIAALRTVFRMEARELLENLQSCLLDLERAPGTMELVDATFRHLHTLKGIASMYGFERVANIAHGLESSFEKARQGSTEVTRDVILLALDAHDCMLSLVSGEEHEEAGESTRARADDLIASIGGKFESEAEIDFKVAEPIGLARNKRYLISLRPASNALFRGLRPLSILNELRTLGECKVVAKTTDVPLLGDLDTGTLYLSWDIEIFTDEARSRIEDAFMFLDTEEFSIVEATPELQSEADIERRSGGDRRSAARRTDKPGTEDTVRVSAGRLDQLVDMVGELVTAHGALANAVSSNEYSRVGGIAEDIGRLTEGLRVSVLDIRMVPIGTLVGRFRRHVRDLAGQLGKEVDIVVDGAETELDKGVLDRIAEPVLHVLRNSIDHGIEAPEVRLATGKPRRGTITLSAFQTAGNVYVKISDDGQGVDLSSVALIAGEVVGIEKAAELGSAGLTEMLFRPGFSTNKSVTNVSGRGVGLDVVRRVIQELRGTVDLKTDPGKGTTFILKLPLTLAIVEGLVAHVGEERYIFPLAVVESCVEVRQSAAWREHGRDSIEVQDKLLPLISLRRYFEVGGEQPSAEMAVVVSVEGERFGVVVDAVRDSIQAVIKPLSIFLRGSPSFSGTTVLGDGQVVPVLDVSGLLRANGGGSRPG